MTTRDVILDAAVAVMRARGLARATTKEIARAAGFSEATLYKHFADKADLLVAVLRERSPGFAALGRALHERVGQGRVVDNLTAVAAAAIELYTANLPMLGSIFSEPEILETHKEGLRRQGAGPHVVNLIVTDYLRGEQAAGRIRPDADLVAAAGLLLGACLQHAFLGHMGWAERRPDAEAAAAFARTVAAAITPPPSPHQPP